jgi:DNA-binding CsgD family transcriptional regulator
MDGISTNGRTSRRGRYRSPIQCDADRGEAVALSLQGRSQREIGAALGISASVVNADPAQVRQQWTLEAIEDADATTCR